MSDARFNVVFQGQVVAGANPETVQANFARLFRIEDPAKLAAYFSGRRVVLKKDADQAAAMKLRATLKQAGVLCELESLAAEPVVAEPPPVAAPDTASAAPEQADDDGEREMVGTIRVGGEGFAGPFRVDPVGTTLDQEPPEQNIVVPDVGSIQLAPPGSDMGQIKNDKPPVTPDISHLELI